MKAWLVSGVFFVFFIFQKKIYRNIFLVLGFTVLYPYRPAGGGRGPTARQGGGRDLYINTNKFIFRRGPWRESAAPLPGGRPPTAPPVGGRGLPPGRGAAGSLQGPLRKINLFLFTYRSLPPPCWAVGPLPLPPPCRAIGVQNCKT